MSSRSLAISKASPPTLLPIRQLSSVFNHLSSRSILSSSFKWLVVLVFLVNHRSWPLVWHFRVFLPLLRLRLQALAVRLRSRFLLHPAPKRARIFTKWLDALSPVGKSPFEVKYTYTTYATPDDCDYNFHLSNSCYGKSLDAARLGYVLELNAEFFRDGGWMPLAGTSYFFAREIAMWERYDVRVYVAGWDSKWALGVPQEDVITNIPAWGCPLRTVQWTSDVRFTEILESESPQPPMYMVGKFVSRDKKGRKSKAKAKSKALDTSQTPEIAPSSQQQPEDSLVLVDNALLNSTASINTNAPTASLHTAASPSSLPTPSSTPGTSTPNPTTSSSGTSSSGSIPPALASLWPEAEGEVLHCVTVSQLCYKLGRITVPPAVVLAGAGLGAQFVRKDSEPATGTSIPTNDDERAKAFWSALRDMRKVERGTKWTKMQETMRGGWREAGDAPGERWWEEAMASYEEERKKRVALVEGLGKLGSLGL